MTNKELVSKLKAWKGPVYVAALVKDDIIYVQVVKKDLILQVTGKFDGMANVEEKDGALYFDSI